MSNFLVEPHGRIGLFGGTFDPPHWGHIQCAVSAANLLNLDQLAFLPSPHPPHKKDKNYSPYKLRRRMVELCLPIDPRFRLCLVEEGELPGTTLETVQKLRETGFTEENCHLIWLMGSDSLLDLPNWHRPDDLLVSIEVAILPRAGFDAQLAPDAYLGKIRLLDTPVIKLSANRIRNRDSDLYESVPPAVADFIVEQTLYGY